MTYGTSFFIFSLLLETITYYKTDFSLGRLGNFPC